MRIGLVIYASLDVVSGGYLYDRMLVHRLRQDGHTVEIVALPWRGYALHLADGFLPTFRRRLQGLRTDLLLQDELNHPSLVGANRLLRRRGGFPLVSIVHHLRCSERHPAAYRPLYRAVEKYYVNSVDGFIFNSRTTEAAVDRLLDGERPGIVAPAAADHLRPPPAAAVLSLLTERAFQPGPLRVLFVGNVIERKGLHTLLTALSRLPRTAWQLDVVGSLAVDRRYSARIRRQIVRLALEERVTLHGGVDSDRLKSALAAAHVLALPSYEGFGIIYLEAMAYGLPVIASTAGAAHEIITPGVEGFLIAPGDDGALTDRLALFLGSRTLLQRMGESARHRYDQHPTWEASMGRAARWLVDLSGATYDHT